MKTLFLCGAGNSEAVRLALRLNRLSARWRNIVLLDDNSAKHGRTILGVEIAGGFDLLVGADPAQSETSNLVARTTLRRKCAQERIDAFGISRASLIDPGTDIEGADLGDNLVIYQHSTIGPESSIGDGSVMFMGAIVGHESRLGKGCILAPHAVLNARVTLAEAVYVGTHAAILPEIDVGAGAVIGAGSVVMQDVPAGATVMGAPAQLIGTASTRGENRSDRPDWTPSEHEPAPPPPLEAIIAQVWKAALGVEHLRACDNFFHLGGDSMAALQITFRLRQLLQTDIALSMIFDNPTVSGLAARLEALALTHADEEMLAHLVDQMQEQPNS